jgi:NAD(P) transhydrogenase
VIDPSFTYDVIVIGCGPAGERAAIQAARADKRVAVIERAGVLGGACVNWGTIPSKTLRESALYVHGITHNKLEGIKTRISDEITVSSFMHREQAVVQRELELINKSLARYEIEVLEGRGRLEDPHTVALLGHDGAARMRLRGEVIVIATGTRPNRPDDVPFDGRCIFDSDTILRMPRLPRSMIVLGAGVIGLEYASIFAALGLEVTLVDRRDQILSHVDREIVGRLAEELKRLGIVMVLGDRRRMLEPLDRDPPLVRCHLEKGGILEAESILYCAGRYGNTENLGLEEVGIVPTERGLLEVNEHFQTAIPHIYAVGDVVGYPALASTSMEQGRQAIRHAFSVPGPQARTEELPFAIYTIPEVSYIGETEERVKERGIDYEVGRGLYRLNPRGQISGRTGGILKLIFERGSEKLLGVHIVGSYASELIHIGQAFLSSGGTASRIAETLYNYPTFSDLYRHAAYKALARLRHTDDGSG